MKVKLVRGARTKLPSPCVFLKHQLAGVWRASQGRKWISFAGIFENEEIKVWSDKLLVMAVCSRAAPPK
jgi:hypothetical protein